MTLAEDPQAFEILEVRIVLSGVRHDLFILLGLNEVGRVGGWYRRYVDPVQTLVVLHDLLATGFLDEGWKRGYPPGKHGGAYIKGNVELAD